MSIKQYLLCQPESLNFFFLMQCIRFSCYFMFFLSTLFFYFSGFPQTYWICMVSLNSSYISKEFNESSVFGDWSCDWWASSIAQASSITQIDTTFFFSYLRKINCHQHLTCSFGLVCFLKKDYPNLCILGLRWLPLLSEIWHV